jgi:DNA-binding IclR family transcriptional regulator
MDVRPHDRRGSAGPGETRVLTPDERDVPTGAAALAKGLYLLDVIGEAATPPRFKDLQAATGLPKGTLARMLNTLVLFRLIRQEDSDNTYRLGHRLFELAHRVWESFDLRGAAAPVLERLAEETRETAALCAIDNDEALYIDQRSRGGPYGFRIEIGRRAPLHCTAGGKALLAFAQPHEQRAIFDRIRLERFTDATFTQEDALLADLALARARGYAVSLEEHVAGVASVAAPIFDHTGRAVAAIGVFGPSSRLTSDRLHVTGRDLMAAGAADLRQCRRHADEHHAEHASGRARSIRRSNACCPGARISRKGRSGRRGRSGSTGSISSPPRSTASTRRRGANEEVMLPRLVSAVVERRWRRLAALTQDGLEASISPAAR